MVLLKTMAKTKICCFSIATTLLQCISRYTVLYTMYRYIHILRMFTDSAACGGFGEGGGRQKVPHTLPLHSAKEGKVCTVFIYKKKLCEFCCAAEGKLSHTKRAQKFKYSSHLGRLSSYEGRYFSLRTNFLLRT